MPNKIMGIRPYGVVPYLTYLNRDLKLLARCWRFQAGITVHQGSSGLFAAPAIALPLDARAPIFSAPMEPFFRWVVVITSSLRRAARQVETSGFNAGWRNNRRSCAVWGERPEQDRPLQLVHLSF